MIINIYHKFDLMIVNTASAHTTLHFVNLCDRGLFFVVIYWTIHYIS